MQPLGCEEGRFEKRRIVIAVGSRRYARKPRGDQTRVNGQITARRVRVVDEKNEQVGVVTREEAIALAEDVGLDLVEVAASADPPVCRILDYGQYKYQKSKREHEARKHQKGVQLKEVKMRPRTDAHDFDFKRKHAISFLAEGKKVKVTVQFRGREMAHQDLGRALLDRFFATLTEVAQQEIPPKMEGRTMSMIVVPMRGTVKSKPPEPRTQGQKPPERRPPEHRPPEHKPQGQKPLEPRTQK